MNTHYTSLALNDSCMLPRKVGAVSFTQLLKQTAKEEIEEYRCLMIMVHMYNASQLQQQIILMKN